MIAVEVLLFATLRERAGRHSIDVELADGATVADALRLLGDRRDPLADALAAMSVVTAVNRDYATRDTALAPGDELALIPPVSGGATLPGRHVRVHDGQLSHDRLARAVATRHSGAIVTFQGTPRNVDRLDYEAYVPMAEARIAAIIDDALARHQIHAAAAEHRIGSVPLGEPSVVVAVSAAHRGPAFEAAREMVDRIKAEAPIWKREIAGERAEWVQGAPPPPG